MESKESITLVEMTRVVGEALGAPLESELVKYSLSDIAEHLGPIGRRDWTSGINKEGKRVFRTPIDLLYNKKGVPRIMGIDFRVEPSRTTVSFRYAPKKSIEYAISGTYAEVIYNDLEPKLRPRDKTSKRK